MVGPDSRTTTCTKCSAWRHNVFRHKQQQIAKGGKKSDEASPFTSHATMSEAQKDAKLKRLVQATALLKKQVARLKESLEVKIIFQTIK